MKKIITLGGLVMLGLGVLYFVPSTQEFVTERVVEVEKVETVDALEARIKAAQDDAQASTTAKAQAAYDAAYEQSMNEVKLKVISDYKKEIEKIETNLSKEVGAY